MPSRSRYLSGPVAERDGRDRGTGTPADRGGRHRLLLPEQRTEVLFILEQGRVRVFRLSPAGKALTTAIITPGTIFGEMAILGQRMHDNFAEALEPCVICLTSREDVQQMLLSDPGIAARIAETLSSRLVEMEQRLSDVMFKAVPQRIASALLTLGRAEARRQKGLPQASSGGSGHRALRLG